MTLGELSKGVEAAYTEILERKQKVRDYYDAENLLYSRISFEEISLDDMLDSLLIPILPDLIDDYASLPWAIRCKSYLVYIGTLCEIVKNGLIDGGILKTIDKRIGTFDRNHHYALLKEALEFEGIEIINKPRRFEETIINEAGIPRGYNKRCLEFFAIIWKWLHAYSKQERMDYLESYLNDKPLRNVYIIDPVEKKKLDKLKKEVSSFSEKVLRTCKKLDSVYEAIDQYPDHITSDNLEAVAEDISNTLGFNILTVVRSDSLKQYLLDYSQQVSFSKFNRIIDNLTDTEQITLPTGRREERGKYTDRKMMGGRHVVRGNSYDVSYPLPLKIRELYLLTRQEPLLLGNAVLYTSDEDITVEVDGYEKNSRLFYDENLGWLNVYYGIIKPASYIYIDGIPIGLNQPFFKNVYIGKYWDHTQYKYGLALCVSTLRFADPTRKQQPTELICNGISIVNGMTNRSGSFRISDKWISLESFTDCQSLAFEFYVGGIVVESWTINILDCYIWGKQSGFRVKDQIDLSNWFGVTRLIVFSKKEPEQSHDYKYLYDVQDYHVYEKQFNRDDSNVEVCGKVIPIIRPDHAYLDLVSEFTVLSGEICLQPDEPISVGVINSESRDTSEMILVLEHEGDKKSYNLSSIDEYDLMDLQSMMPVSIERDGGAGKWTISLYDHGLRCNSISLVILPRLEIIPAKKCFLEDETVSVTVKSSVACFEHDGEYVNHVDLQIGKAKLDETEDSFVAMQIDFMCTLDRYEITVGESYAPDIWALRTRTNNGVWSTLPSGLDYDELMIQPIYIITTKDIEVRIICGMVGELRHIKSGASPVDMEYFLYDAKSITTVLFCDEYNVKLRFTVVRTARYSITLDVGAEEATVRALYKGPVGAKVDLRVFVGQRLLIPIHREAYYDRFTINLHLERSKVLNQEVTIEARTDNQDYQRLFKGCIDWTDPTDNSEAFVLSRETPLITLLENRTVNTEDEHLGLLLPLLDRRH